LFDKGSLKDRIRVHLPVASTMRYIRFSRYHKSTMLPFTEYLYNNQSVFSMIAIQYLYYPGLPQFHANATTERYNIFHSTMKMATIAA
jgi:hypothetical protein